MNFRCNYWYFASIFCLFSFYFLFGKMSVNKSNKVDVASDSAEELYTLSPSPASTTQPVAKDTGKVLVDYKTQDYRGFIFVVHEEHGMVLLKCTRKKSKGPHFQVPGGHVDEPEFLEAGKQRFDLVRSSNDVMSQHRTKHFQIKSAVSVHFRC